MGIESLAMGLFGVAAQTAGKVAEANAQASAQANLNRETMAFNRKEAEKARNFSAAEALKERTFNAQQAEIGRAFSNEQILAARKFEERMANTAHQREVNDLTKAGLNPILSVTGGNGAAVPVSPIIGASSASQSGSPSGVAASVSGLHAPKKANYVGAFVSNAMEGLRLDNDIKRAKASETEAEAAIKHAEAHTKEAETGAKAQSAAEREIDKRIERIDTDISIAMKDYDIRERLAKAGIEEKHAVIDELYSRVGVNSAMADKLGMETRELEKRVRYGAFFATYLPEKVGKWFEDNMISFAKDHPEVLKFFETKTGGEITDKEKASAAAIETYEKFKELFGGND